MYFAMRNHTYTSNITKYSILTLKVKEELNACIKHK